MGWVIAALWVAYLVYQVWMLRLEPLDGDFPKVKKQQTLVAG